MKNLLLILGCSILLVCCKGRHKEHENVNEVVEKYKGCEASIVFSTSSKKMWLFMTCEKIGDYIETLNRAFEKNSLLIGLKEKNVIHEVHFNLSSIYQDQNLTRIINNKIINVSCDGAALSKAVLAGINKKLIFPKLSNTIERYVGEITNVDVEQITFMGNSSECTLKDESFLVTMEVN